MACSRAAHALQPSPGIARQAAVLCTQTKITPISCAHRSRPGCPGGTRCPSRIWACPRAARCRAPCTAPQPCRVCKLCSWHDHALLASSLLICASQSLEHAMAQNSSTCVWEGFSGQERAGGPNLQKSCLSSPPARPPMAYPGKPRSFSCWMLSALSAVSRPPWCTTATLGRHQQEHVAHSSTVSLRGA